MSSCTAGELMHVLAVDDSSVDRAVIATLLRSSKHRVTTVDSGKRALELLGLESDVNMIITDYWMPEMTGFELLKKVKESSTFFFGKKSIPVSDPLLRPMGVRPPGFESPQVNGIKWFLYPPRACKARLASSGRPQRESIPGGMRDTRPCCR